MADDTATEARVESEDALPVPSVTPSGPSRRTGGRIAMLMVGGLLALVALGPLTGATCGLWLHATQRSHGYVMTTSKRFTTGSHALATRTLHVSSKVPSFLYGRDCLGNVRIRGRSANPRQHLFIGIDPNAGVDRYLAGVAHADLVDVSTGPLGARFRPSYRARPGDKPATPPGRARFWVARVAGQGSQALTWSVEPGRWAVVVMRPDGSRGVSADVAAARSCRP